MPPGIPQNPFQLSVAPSLIWIFLNICFWLQLYDILSIINASQPLWPALHPAQTSKFSSLRSFQQGLNYIYIIYIYIHTLHPQQDPPGEVPSIQQRYLYSLQVSTKRLAQVPHLHPSTIWYGKITAESSKKTSILCTTSSIFEKKNRGQSTNQQCCNRQVTHGHLHQKKVATSRGPCTTSA